RRPPSVGYVEPSLNPCGLRAGTHQMGARSRSSHEREPHGQHGLARAGLTGQDREPLGQLEIKVTDDTETADVKLTEHARILVGTTDIAGGRERRGGLSRVTREVELVSHPREEAR